MHVFTFYKLIKIATLKFAKTFTHLFQNFCIYFISISIFFNDIDNNNNLRHVRE